MMFIRIFLLVIIFLSGIMISFVANKGERGDPATNFWMWVTIFLAIGAGYGVIIL